MNNLFAKHKTKLIITLAALFAGSAIAGSGGAEFEPIYDQVAGGALGETCAILAFGFAMFNVMKQNFIKATGAFVVCLLYANAETVIESFLTAGVPL